ncbi:MAG: N4-(beta-N-acetylglucosaminyl)-L-asparaginase [Gemmataceae bacterium]|nr:N4-(beta-N-acetylglucosaminyl)-L-asparaginase [Gemmataceae bacterium]
MNDYRIIATWSFGKIAVEVAAPLLQKGKPALDAALAGAQAVEDDPKVNSVGYGGIPNSVGVVSLDACVMDGKTLSCGAVGCLENIKHAAAVARLVMEKTPHIMLVGQGAQAFALQHGFPLESLVTPESIAEWEKNRPKKGKTAGHDTVTVLARDQSGTLGGVCTTSGLSYKLPGRVGDSPLIGSGLYVDDEAGAAGATGVGEEIIRAGGAGLVVEFMRQGKTPQEACETMIRKVNRLAARRGVHPARVSFLAMDKRGRVGGACSKGGKFVYAFGEPGKIELITAPEIEAL